MPALNSKLRHWVSDEDGARAAAAGAGWPTASRGSRRRGSTRAARSATPTPLQSIADALRTFGADEVIISTHPEGRSNWLERGVVDTARERFAVPITHVVADLGETA